MFRLKWKPPKGPFWIDSVGRIHSGPEPMERRELVLLQDAAATDETSMYVSDLIRDHDQAFRRAKDKAS